jgi:hypothetical protein
MFQSINIKINWTSNILFSKKIPSCRAISKNNTVHPHQRDYFKRANTFKDQNIQKIKINMKSLLILINWKKKMFLAVLDILKRYKDRENLLKEKLLSFMKSLNTKTVHYSIRIIKYKTLRTYLKSSQLTNIVLRTSHM